MRACMELYQVRPMGTYCSMTPPVGEAFPALLVRLTPVTPLVELVLAIKYCGYGTSVCISGMVAPFRLLPGRRPWNGLRTALFKALPYCASCAAEMVSM